MAQLTIFLSQPRIMATALFGVLAATTCAGMMSGFSTRNSGSSNGRSGSETPNPNASTDVWECHNRSHDPEGTNEIVVCGAENGGDTEYLFCGFDPNKCVKCGGSRALSEFKEKLKTFVANQKALWPKNPRIEDFELPLDTKSAQGRDACFWKLPQVREYCKHLDIDPENDDGTQPQTPFAAYRIEQMRAQAAPKVVRVKSDDITDDASLAALIRRTIEPGKNDTTVEKQAKECIKQRYLAKAEGGLSGAEFDRVKHDFFDVKNSFKLRRRRLAARLARNARRTTQRRRR